MQASMGPGNMASQEACSMPCVSESSAACAESMVLDRGMSATPSAEDLDTTQDRVQVNLRQQLEGADRLVKEICRKCPTSGPDNVFTVSSTLRLE